MRDDESLQKYGSKGRLFATATPRMAEALRLLTKSREVLSYPPRGVITSDAEGGKALKKRKLYSILCLIAVLVLAGCGGGVSGTPSAISTTITSSTNTPASQPSTGKSRSNIRIVVVTHGTAADPFWSVVKRGVDDAAKEMGVKVEYRAPETFDMVKMSQLIDAAVASKPDGLVVSIPDADALRDSITKAVQAGIPVVSINSGADVSKQFGALVHIGQSEFEAGVGAGEQMKKAGVTSALCINHEVGNVGLDQRCDGFKKGLGGNVKVVGVEVSNPTDAQNKIKTAIAQNPGINGILTLGPLGSTPTLAALGSGGPNDKIKLATFDLSPDVLQAIADGKMLFAIDQQQYLQGYLPIVFLTKYAEYQVIPTGQVMTGPAFVTKENAARVIELSKQGIR